jgi:hypothetical protein
LDERRLGPPTGLARRPLTALNQQGAVRGRSLRLDRRTVRVAQQFEAARDRGQLARQLAGALERFDNLAVLERARLDSATSVGGDIGLHELSDSLRDRLRGGNLAERQPGL